MALYQHRFSYQTHGRNSYNITREVNDIVKNSSIHNGLCHVFIQHTSASLMITENADPDVRRDLETIMQRLAPDADPDYLHTLEGPDDMSAHVRNILTQTELTLPVTNGQLGMGTWQGLFLWEHRTGAFQRNLVVTVQD